MSTTDEGLIPADPDAIGPIFTMDMVEEPEPEAAESPLDAVQTDLDPRYREDFTGLLYLGRLEEECTVAGHRFLLRTPGQDVRLEMGQIIKPFLNTATVEKAWRLITVAAFLQRIDTRLAPLPLTDVETGLRERFEWVRDSITAEMIIVKLYDKCMELDGRTRAVIDELDRLGEA